MPCIWIFISVAIRGQDPTSMRFLKFDVPVSFRFNFSKIHQNQNLFFTIAKWRSNPKFNGFRFFSYPQKVLASDSSS
jgi:hypothetical protein